MIMKKVDEMERFQNEKSAVYAFVFYDLALLIWALFDFFSKGELGLQFTILLAGNVIFLGSKLICNRKMR